MTHSLEPSSAFSSDPSPRSTWHWRFEDASRAALDVAEGSTASQGVGFPSQSDAESWIGEVWRELVEEGVDQVTLLECDREVYGPMSLHAAD
jgi:hypothetical protein